MLRKGDSAAGGPAIRPAAGAAADGEDNALRGPG